MDINETFRFVLPADLILAAESIRHAFESLQRSLKPLREIYFKRADELEDLMSVCNPDRPVEQREAAAKRLVARLGNPIDRHRRPAVRSELERRASTHGNSQANELEHLFMACLFQEIESIYKYTPNQIDEMYRVLRTRLNESATLDCLGDGWRQRTGAARQIEIELESHHAPSAFLMAQVEAKLQVDALIHKAKLSQLEKQVYLNKSDPSVTFDEIAEGLGKSPSTVKTYFYRAEEKINKIKKII